MSAPRTFVQSEVTQLCRGTLLPGRTRLPVPRRTVYQSANLDWLMETATLRQGSFFPSHCAGSYVFFWRSCRIPWALEPRANNCVIRIPKFLFRISTGTQVIVTICVAFLSPFRNFQDNISGSVITASFHIVSSSLSTDVTLSSHNPLERAA